jgi:hypothetical protein
MEEPISARSLVGASLAAALALMTAHAPLSAQSKERGETVWQIGGLRKGFCVLFVVAPQAVSRSLPPNLKLVTAGEATDLHPALRTEVQAQPDLASWIPSHLCFYAVDTITTPDYSVRGDKSGKKPQLFGLWTVSAAESGSGAKRDLALLLVASNGRLIKSGNTMGIQIRQLQAKIGKVPAVDINGVPSDDDRFQVKVGKTLITWDGHPASDSAQTNGSVEIIWASGESSGEKGSGHLTMTPQWSSPMVGSLKVEGKDDLAKALRASPVRFVGPDYRGGGGEIQLSR